MLRGRERSDVDLDKSGRVELENRRTNSNASSQVPLFSISRCSRFFRPLPEPHGGVAVTQFGPFLRSSRLSNCSCRCPAPPRLPSGLLKIKAQRPPGPARRRSNACAILRIHSGEQQLALAPCVVMLVVPYSVRIDVRVHNQTSPFRRAQRVAESGHVARSISLPCRATQSPASNFSSMK